MRWHFQGLLKEGDRKHEFCNDRIRNKHSGAVQVAGVDKYPVSRMEFVAELFLSVENGKLHDAHLYEQRIKELFMEALGILMENSETVVGDCRAVMEVMADCGSIDAEMEAVSDEMEVIAGLILKLIDENAIRKLDQRDYHKKYDGYASRYVALESRMDSLEKERGEERNPV